MIAADEVVEKIKASLPDAEIRIQDLTGSQDHFQVTVVSDAFEGEPLIKRHRMIYDALAEEMKGPIHALSLQTFTFEQWQDEQ